MKVAHWTYFNGSGLTNVAQTMSAAEAKLGIDSIMCDTSKVETWGAGMDADIHVVHSHIPDKLAFDDATKIVVVEHGSPEHCFEVSVTQAMYQGYGAGDSWNISTYLCRRANVVVTFWPRQAAIWKTLTERPVHVIPMGIDRSFWKRTGVLPLAGTPSVFCAENAHTVKWPLDMVMMWPWIVKGLPDARLHAINLPTDQQRWWTSLSVLNNALYTAYIYAIKLGPEGLRNHFSAASFYYSPVRYGDHNRVCLEAASCGCKVISFEGNEYAHYWVREGDQRRQFEDIMDILRGNRPERVPAPVPASEEMAAAMLMIYGAL